MVFPVVMYRFESWTIKKAECQRIHAFELWCWRRLLRVPWTTRRWEQSILKKISPEYWLQILMLKLNLQYFGHPMQRTDSLEKTQMLGKIEGRRWTTGNKMVEWHCWLEGCEFEPALGICDGQGGWACCSPWGRKEWDTTKQLNRLTTNLFTYELKWELLSHVRLFVTPLTASRQASLTFTISWSLLKLMSAELMMPSNHPSAVTLSLLPSIFLSIKVFYNELVPWIRWPKYWRFSFSISPSS